VKREVYVRNRRSKSQTHIPTNQQVGNNIESLRLILAGGPSLNTTSLLMPVRNSVTVWLTE